MLLVIERFAAACFNESSASPLHRNIYVHACMRSYRLKFPHCSCFVVGFEASIALVEFSEAQIMDAEEWVAVLDGLIPNIGLPSAPGVVLEGFESFVNVEVPDLDQITLQMNTENLFVPREIDYKAMPKPCFEIRACPCAEKCDPVSWKQAKCWSLIGPYTALKYLMYHLVVSERHNMNEDEAYSIVVDHLQNKKVSWICRDYNWACREKYRCFRESTEPCFRESMATMDEDGVALYRGRTMCCKRRRVALVARDFLRE